MKIAADTFWLLVVVRVALDIWSARRPNFKLDIAYAVLFLILGLAILFSGDEDSGLYGSLSIGVAIIWGLWAYFREIGFIAKLTKLSDKKDDG